jgi:O-antigen/teichoic acid export membrane protein
VEAIQGPSGSEHKKLEGTAIRATIWTIVAYGSSQGLRMVNSMVLTRLLMPEYFGLMALISTLVMGMTLLSDVGLLPSVVGSPRGDEPVFLNTAWSVQIIRGFALWVVALILASPLALFYHDHRIVKLLPVLALSMIISGFASTNLLSAARHIGVRRLLVVDFAAQVTGMIVIILWAKFYPSVWALKRSYQDSTQPHSGNPARAAQLAGLGQELPAQPRPFRQMDHGRNGLLLFCHPG